MQELNNIMKEIDSSKVKDYLTCPRRFFYRHVLGWKSEMSSLNLVFGEAWHKALEYLLTRGVSKENVSAAFDEFLSVYRREFSEDTDLTNGARSPGNALSALLYYVTLYKDDLFGGKEVLELDEKKAVEIYGTVPISMTEDRVMHFRLDAIVTDGNYVYIVDHKTSGSNNPIYRDQWALSNQVLTYLHAANALFEPNKVGGMIIDLTIFRKSGNDTFLVPIKKSIDIMDEWLWSINEIFSRIERDVSLLSECKESDPLLFAFPKNPTGCVAYNRKCEYFDFCTAWTNPLRRADSAPLGFRVEFWSPREIEKEKENVITL